jgi:hypothetical protein
MSAPRKSLNDHVRTACKSGDLTHRLNDPDPLLACRLPCPDTDLGTCHMYLGSNMLNKMMLFHSLELSRDPWFPDGTVCQADTSLTSFCVQGRCEPFLCPSPSLGDNDNDNAGYPFLLHEGRCETAPSLLPNRPSSDKGKFISESNDDIFKRH